MGGCFSLPDSAKEHPGNGQHPQPSCAARVAKSLCECIRDFFMKCLFSKWCFGGFDCSTVKDTWGSHPTSSKAPQAEEDLTPYSRYRRSCSSLGDIEECWVEEITNVASNEDNQRASDRFRIWKELPLTELTLQNGRVLKRLTDITLNLNQNPDNRISNPFNETETSSGEELTDVEDVATGTRGKKTRTSALNQFGFGD